MKTLRQHQVEAIEFLKKEDTLGKLLWHEMGLGKTLSSLVYMRGHIARLKAQGVVAPRILVIPPKSLVAEWRAQIAEDAPDMAQYVTYLPYSQLNKAERLIYYCDIRGIICDESHMLKSVNTNRIKEFSDLLLKIHESPGGFLGGRLVFLSGTPMLNHAAEIFTTWATLTSKDLATAARRIQDIEKYDMWKSSFTNQKVKSWSSWRGDKHYAKDKPEGVKEEDKLMQLIGHITHLRKSEDCLDLPQAQEIPVNLGMSDDALLAEADIERPEEYMAVLERLARAKTPHAVEWIRSFRAQSKEQLVVFSPYKFPLETIAAKFSKDCVMVTGAQTQKERDENVRMFKSGERSIFLGTYAAAGVGLNLQCAATGLYLGYPWTWALIAQAMARINRQGQTKHTKHYFLTSGENDTSILWTVLGKKDATESVEDGLKLMHQSTAPKLLDTFI